MAPFKVAFMTLVFWYAFIRYSHFSHGPCNEKLFGVNESEETFLHSNLFWGSRSILMLIWSQLKCFEEAGRWSEITPQRNLSDFYMGVSVLCLGIKSTGTLVVTGVRLVCQQKTSMCVCLWHALHELMAAGSPSLPWCQILPHLLQWQLA